MVATTWGIDVSNHQAGASLAKAKAAGCGFIFAKATEGLTYTDSAFAGFRAQAKAAGLPFGAYHFARPQAGRTGAQEAAHFLAVYSYAAGDLPPVLDIETSSLSAAQTVTFALAWLAAVEKATGVRPYVYTYAAFAGNYLAAGRALAAYPLWLASYRTTEPPAPAPWSSWAIWQHSSGATIPGISGPTDRNITHLPLPTQEADMPLTDADAATIWLHGQADMSAWSRVVAAQTSSANAARDAAAALAIVKALTVDAIANAVVAKLPAGSTPVDIPTLAAAVVDQLAQRPMQTQILGKA